MSTSDNNMSSMHRHLLPDLKSALQSFATSASTFRILRTVPPCRTPSAPPAPATLYVLDSSFNPPTRAHLRIATSALLHDHGARPKRLLLLLATQNADKAPKPASLDHRLVMMTIFAQDLRAQFAGQAQGEEEEDDDEFAVDVGVTTLPYFHHKAAAIEESGLYPDPPPEQVHLTGYDTLIRLLDPKYYPPGRTLAPLEGFLGRHRVRVTYRTGSEWGGREEQEKYLRDLREGKREGEGGRREWADRFEMVEGREAGEEVVSSTKVRDAVREGDMEALSKLVTDGVGEWIVQEGLYTATG